MSTSNVVLGDEPCSWLLPTAYSFTVSNFVSNFVACPKCGELTEVYDAFCRHCGAELKPKKACPHCGKDLP